MQTITKTYRFRLYPTAHQKALFAKTFGCCRYVWNRALEISQHDRKLNGRRRPINEIIKMLPVWKNQLIASDGTYWLKEADSMALQQSLRNLDRAYKNHADNPLPLRKAAFQEQALK